MPPARHGRPIIINPRRKLITVTSAAGSLVVASLIGAAVGCSHPVTGMNSGSPAAATTVEPPLVPPAPQPVADGPCRYLSAASVQAANGERVAAVRISGTAAGQPYPACFFLTGNGAVQLRTWIVVSTPRAARATVDTAAPVNTSDLAELPGGWSGGSQPTAGGAVFAVARQGTAVVVTTNQRQTISARQIAAQVITTLGL